MHAEGKKATQTSKAADNEREGVLYLNPLSKEITCKQLEIRHLFKIEVSSFLSSRLFTLSNMPRMWTHLMGKKSGQKQNRMF